MTGTLTSKNIDLSSWDSLYRSLSAGDTLAGYVLSRDENQAPGDEL
jgi:hypothetical protein